MPPKDDDQSAVGPSPTGCEVIGGEDAAPVTDTPSPPETPSPPPPPLVVHLPPEDALHRALHPFVPYAPFPGEPSDCLPLNCNLQQVLRGVTGQEELQEVVDLKLRVIASEMSLQRVCMNVPNLRELTLDGSSLVSLRDLGCTMVHLEVLRISGCGLDSLDGLFGLTSLVELHAGDNRIDDISPCTALPLIRHIDLHKNCIADIAYISFLSICSHLEHLVLAQCPAAEVRGYRKEVRSSLPRLITLDGEKLDNQDDDKGSDEEFDDDDDEDDDDDDDDSGDGGLDDWISGWLPSGPDSQLQEDPDGETSPTLQRKLDDADQKSLKSSNESSASDPQLLRELTCETDRTTSGAQHDRERCASAGCGSTVSATLSNWVSNDVVPSRLTSGPLLSGNLVLSRRGRSRRPLTSVDTARRDMCYRRAGDDDLLMGMKKWQAEYRAYRDADRMKRWDEETLKDVEVETARPCQSQVYSSKTVGSSPDCVILAQGPGVGDIQVEESHDQHPNGSPELGRLYN